MPIFTLFSAAVLGWYGNNFLLLSSSFAFFQPPLPPLTFLVFEVFFQLPSKKSVKKGILYIPDVIPFHCSPLFQQLVRCSDHVESTRRGWACSVFLAHWRRFSAKHWQSSLVSAAIVHSVAWTYCSITLHRSAWVSLVVGSIRSVPSFL